MVDPELIIPPISVSIVPAEEVPQFRITQE